MQTLARNNFRICNFLVSWENAVSYLFLTFFVNYPVKTFLCQNSAHYICIKLLLCWLYKQYQESIPRIYILLPQKFLVPTLVTTHYHFASFLYCLLYVFLLSQNYFIRDSCHTFALHHFHIIAFQTITIALVVSSFSLLPIEQGWLHKKQ